MQEQERGNRGEATEERKQRKRYRGEETEEKIQRRRYRGEQMNKYRVLSVIFAVLAVILLVIMGITVIYNYTAMLYDIRYLGFSAPANSPFLLIIPYGLAIIVSLVLSSFFRRRDVKKNG